MVALNWQGGVTVGIMVAGLSAMGLDVIPPDFTFWGMVVALLAIGVIDVTAAGAGFGNASSLAIVALYTVSAGVEQTGALDAITGRVLGSTRSASIALARVVLPVAFASAFLSNLMVVSLLIPTLRAWSRRHGVAAKQLLIPLSFATVLGGTATTMGTSTNLLVAGLMQQRYAAAGNTGPPPFGLFTITPYGVPYALWGAAYLVAMARWLLPRTDAPSGGGTSRRGRAADASLLAADDAMVSALAVPRGSPAAGRALDDVLARAGVTLVAVGRGGRVRPPPPPASSVRASVAADRVAREGDVLYVSGRVAAARQLAAEAGLAPVDDASEDDALDALGVGGLPPRAASAGAGMTVVTPRSVDGAKRAPSPLAWDDGGAASPPSASSPSSSATPSDPPPPPPTLLRVRVRVGAPLAGTSVRDAGLRSRFGATVVAVSRAGPRASTTSGASTPTGAPPPPGRIGDIVLSAGDAVVLAVGPTFDADAPEFAVNFDAATPLDGSAAGAHAFSTALTVKRGSRIDGRTPADAGLVGVPGVLLFAVRRADGETLAPPPPTFVLRGGDTLYFAGAADAVPFLRRFPGLAHSADGHAKKLPTHAMHRRLVQACVSSHSPLAGRTLRAVAFRERYGAVVVAIHRAGAAVAADIASVALKAGDVLVLEAGPGFAAAAATQRAFSVISEMPNSAPPKPFKRWIALAWVAAMVLAQVTTSSIGGRVEARADLFLLASLTAAGMLASRCMSFDAARRAIEWDVYVTVAFAFGVATAMEKSGVGELVAAGFKAALTHGGRSGPPPVPVTLTAIYLATCIISEFISNDAAAALMWPISAELGEALGVAPRDAAIAVCLGGSAGWIIPYSYQTNLLVLSAGQYSFAEFATFGAPFYLWQVPFVAFAFWCGKRWWIPLLVAAAAFGVSPFVPIFADRLADKLAARRGRRRQAPGFSDGGDGDGGKA